MTAYYNEIEPYAAQWLRNLIAAGHIAPGVVDERSIEDVEPADLKEFTQCHFFAGIGVWSHALRRAGWSDNRPVWTGSCPCQGFSAAGQGLGFNDQRHLWPHWHHLIRECRPADVFGEQVASPLALAWLDLVQTDMEGTDYAFGAVDTCVAGFGAPQIRQRLYFAAHDLRLDERLWDTHSARTAFGIPEQAQRQERSPKVDDDGGDRLFRPGTGRPPLIGLADTDGREQQRVAVVQGNERDGADAGRAQGRGGVTSRGETVGLADVPYERRDQRTGLRDEAAGCRGSEPTDVGCDSRPCPTNGYWRDADWLGCLDGKWRPVRPGTFPLVNGSAPRMGCLCAGCGTETRRQDQSVLVLQDGFVRDKGCVTKEILRQRMLQASSARTTSDEQEHRTLQGEEISKPDSLRKMPCYDEPARPPHRHKPNERQERQPDGTMSNMPFGRAYKDNTEIDMRSLWNEISGKVTQESEQDLFCPVCQRMGTHFCEQEVANDRTGRLRAYGNAITVAQAEGFINAYQTVYPDRG